MSSHSLHASQSISKHAVPSHVHANQKAIVCPGRCHCRDLMNGHSLTGPEHEHGRGKWIEAERERERRGGGGKKKVDPLCSFFRPFFGAMMLCHGSSMAEGSSGLVECGNFFSFSATEEHFSSSISLYHGKLNVQTSWKVCGHSAK